MEQQRVGNIGSSQGWRARGLMAHLRSGLLAVCLAMPAAVQAQAMRDGNYEEVGLNFDLRHLGNAARTDPDSAAARGLSRSDERLTVGVDLALNRDLGRNTLRVDANVGYDFYRRNTQLNRERIGVGAAAGINVGPCLADLSARLDRRQSDLESITYLDLPGADSVQNTETTRSYRAEGRCGYVYGLRPSLGYEHRRGSNSEPIRDLSNYRSNRVFGGLAYDHPVIGKAKLTYERETVDFPKRSGSPLAPLSGYRNDEVRLQLSREMGSVLMASAMVAYSSLKPDNPGTAGFKGVTWRLAATVTPGLRLQINASTERSINPALGGEALYSRQRVDQVRATYAVSGRVSLNGGFSLSRRTYAGAQANFGPLLQEDSFRRIFAGVSMRAGQRLELGLEAGQEKRNGTGTAYDFSSSYVGLRGRLKL